MLPALIASLGFAVFVFRAFWRGGCYWRFLRRVPVGSRRRSARLRISRRVVNSLCRLAKPVSPSPEAFHNRAANQGFLFAFLATPSFTEGRAIFFAGDVVFLLRLLAFTRFALAGAGTKGPVLAAAL